MKIVLLMVFMVIILMSDCCPKQRQREEPPYPNQVTGWVYREERGLKILGEFVLQKNESTDNGKVQVKLLEVIPGNPCAEPNTFGYLAKAKLQFIRMSDSKVLCEEIFGEKGSETLSATNCNNSLNEFGLLGIYIFAINLNDGWVHFELLG